MKIKSVCVYCSSSNVISDTYFKVAQQVGEELGRRGFTLVFGGASVGLMNTVAQAAKDTGSEIIGVIPEIARGTAYVFDARRVIYTKTLAERKQVMQEESDAFIVLPGGFGTLDEAIDTLTLKQLKFHTKPLVFLNSEGYFTMLQSFLQVMIDEKFASAEHHAELGFFADHVPEAFQYIEGYTPPDLPLQWY